MTLKINNEKYETRAFDCWPRMKELRSKHFWHTWNAQKDGNLLVLGMTFSFVGLLAGTGDFANPTIGAHFTRLARTPNAEGITQAVEAAEAWGLGRDVCGAMKCHLGQLFQGLSTTSPMGDHVKHDFAMQCVGCHAIVKSTQIAAEHLGLPFIFIDAPDSSRDYGKKYLLTQLQEIIEWLEKKTGRKYDDEKLVEGVKNEWYCGAMWSKCAELLQNIPAPAGIRTMFSLRLPFVTGKHKKECAEYVNMLYDELKYRVANKISDLGVEKLRLNHENLHPLYRADVLRSPERYGALFVGGQSLCTFGIWDYYPDGTHVAAKTPEQRGIKIKNREDALNALIDMRLGSGEDGIQREAENRDRIIYKRTQDWHTDAVVIHYDRPCQANPNTLEARVLLQEKGIPVGTYTSSQGDPRDFDERRILGPGGELTTFYESLGLTRLESPGHSGPDAE